MMLSEAEIQAMQAAFDMEARALERIHQGKSPLPSYDALRDVLRDAGALVQAFVEGGYYEGNPNGCDECRHCGACQPSIFSKEPERHTNDCHYVKAQAWLEANQRLLGLDADGSDPATASAEGGR